MPKKGAAPQHQALPESVRQEILRLSAPPLKLSATKIAQQLGISERTVQRVRAAARSGHSAGATDPKLAAFVEDPELLAITIPALAWCADGSDPAAAAGAFEAFFLRYSGFAYLPHHAKEWVRAIFDHDRLLLNVPPRHAKSEILSVWLPIFMVTMDRNIQILLISQTEKLARKFSNKIAWHLEYNAKLTKDFGRFKPMDDSAPWRPLSGELMVEGRTRATESGDLTLQIRGSGQQILGMEADLIIADDLVDRESSWSEATREHLSEYFHGDVMTRRSPRGRAVVVGQRIHFLDLYAELAEKVYSRGAKAGTHVWHHINYAAVTDWDTEGVLWPEEWPFDRLMEVYEDLKRKGNSWLFEAMYQQNPIPPEERLVMDEWIYGDETHFGCLDHSRVSGMPAVNPEEEEWVRVVSMDPSPTRAAGLIVADVLSSRDEFRCAILEATRARMDVREMLRQVERTTSAYNPGYLIFEQNAAQRWFLQDPGFLRWRDTHNVRVIAHTTGKHKTDPQFGVQSLAVAFEFGRIRLPWGDGRGREMSKLLIEEATSYPFGPYSDLLMALWFIAFNHSKLTPPRGARGPQQAVGPGFHVPRHLARDWGDRFRR